jgi:hypothetical protein
MCVTAHSSTFVIPSAGKAPDSRTAIETKFVHETGWLRASRFDIDPNGGVSIKQNEMVVGILGGASI